MFGHRFHSLNFVGAYSDAFPIRKHEPLMGANFPEVHLRQVLKSYADYYNRASEHPSVYVVEEKRLC
jgi:hypothetical protein